MDVSPQSYAIISWEVAVVIAVFVIMVLIPFLIAIKELLDPKDNKPLEIDMLHSKDPLYFGKQFKKIISENIENKGIVEGNSEIFLSKKEVVEICIAKWVPPYSKIDRLLYVKGDFSSGENAALTKEVYIKGYVKVGKRNVLRAVYSEKDILVERDCRISRWLCSEGNIHIGARTHLGRSVGCRGNLFIETGSRFKSAFGLPLVAMNGKQAVKVPEYDYPIRDKAQRYDEWIIFQKHLSVNWTPPGNAVDENNDPQIAKEMEAVAAARLATHWQVGENRVETVLGAPILNNFAARRELVVKSGSVIHGSVKCYKNIIIEPDVVIHGDVFAEGDIKVGPHSILLGHVFSQSSVFIGSDARISSPGNIRSIIAKKRVEIDKHAVIYGYILAEGEGVIR